MHHLQNQIAKNGLKFMLKNKKMTAVSLAVIFFAAMDRFFKILAFNNQASQVNLAGDVLKFSYKSNYYIAFSLPLAGVWLNAVIILIILSLIFYLLKAIINSNQVTALCLFAVAVGAVSNLFDRLAYGYVIDYLDLKHFTVFNLADIMIMTGIICLLFTKSNKLENNFS